MVKRLFCYVLLCMVTLLPLSGQAAFNTMPPEAAQTTEHKAARATGQTPAEQPAMSDCMMHKQRSTQQTAAIATHPCCDNSVLSHHANNGMSCQHTGCQCEHNSTQITIYLPEVNSTTTAPPISPSIETLHTMVVSGHISSLFRPPITII